MRVNGKKVKVHAKVHEKGKGKITLKGKELKVKIHVRGKKVKVKVHIKGKKVKVKVKR